MGRRPHGSLQAPPQCTALVEPWAGENMKICFLKPQPKILPGGRMVASTTARVTLVTAAAATATALPLVIMRSTKICVYDMIIIRQEC